jgi:hypothetical protein
MPSAKRIESTSHRSTHTERDSATEAAFVQARQLYTAFELVRADHLFIGLHYLTDPLIRSLCELTIRVSHGVPQPLMSAREAIAGVRQHQHPGLPIEKEVATIVECLERMTTERCDDRASSVRFSEDAWRILILARSIEKKASRAILGNLTLMAHLAKKVALATVVVLAVLAVTVQGPKAYREWLLSRMEATTEQRVSDIRKLHQALLAFHTEHGHYPTTEGRWDGLYTSYGISSENWIHGLVPKYIESLPRDPRNHTVPDEQYLYWSDGQDFKLLAHNTADAAVVAKIYPEMHDSIRPRRAFGAWSSNGQGK